jgi:hypothetical protein
LSRCAIVPLSLSVMKTKLLLSLLLSFSFYLLSSQVPQGFNYQAIARGSDGKEIANTTLQIKVSILSDTTGFYGSGSGTYIWEEMQSVKTNSLGLFTLTVGYTLATKVQGSALSFSAIDWKYQPLFIGIKINNGAWKNMGTSRLWSVPYSMVAGELEGAVDKLEVIGVDPLSDEALFEVKRKDGQTMFAVYNQGVRVYMPLDTLSKGKKGGFAIGGFSKAKGTVQDYFVVNPDSIRAYIDTNPAKGKKGGFAIGGFDKAKAWNEEYMRVTRDSTRIYLNDTGTKGKKGGFAIGGFDKAKGDIQDFMTVNKDSIRMYIDDTPVKALKGGFAIGGFDKAKGGNASFLNVATDASGKINPSQNRILWYPLKNAFLTGRVLITDSANVGVNSFATGYESKAKGRYSQAMGFKATANGDYSTAIGKNAVADRIHSFAFGEGATASNDESYAIGRGAVASGLRSFAFGSAGVDPLTSIVTDVSRAEGPYSFAIGQGTKSSGHGSIGIGLNNTSSNMISIAIGYYNNATGQLSTAIGGTETASGYNSIAIGATNTSSGRSSVAIGEFLNASSDYSVAIGIQATATAIGAVALGSKANARASNSVSIGDRNTAAAISSTATGLRTIANGSYSFSAGYFTNSKPYAALTIGQYNDTTCSVGGSTSWITSDPLFIAGNGTSLSARSNAFTVYKNGNVKVQSSIQIGNSGSITSNWWEFGYDNGGGAGIDFHSNTSAADASARIYRVGGNDGMLQMVNFGSGNFLLQTPGTTLTLNPSGRVGIGTESPAYALDVVGEIASRTQNAFRLRNAYYSTIFRNDGTDFYILTTNYADPDGTYNSFRPFSFRFSTGEVNFGNYVGIGITNPAYPLHVALAATPANFAYGYLNSLGNTGTNTGTSYYSIFSEFRIRAEEFNADSDVRIKKIKGISNNTNDLELLRKIRVTDFSYIDSISKGNMVHKKVIAQELKEVYPNAVTPTNGYIPSVYARPVAESYNVESNRMVFTMAKEHGLKSGDNIKFIEREGIWNSKVAEVITPTIFTVESYKDHKSVFVYGKEVNDFLTVDYEAISMLNVSATQELIRKTEIQQKLIEAQNERIERLERMVEEMKGAIDNR